MIIYKDKATNKVNGKVDIELDDPLHIRIDTENWAYLNEVKEHFRYYVNGYKFMSQYKCGKWDGKVGLMDSTKRTLPFGLLLELIRYHKKEWSDVPYTLSPEVKQLFVGIKPEYKKDLCFPPYDYQDDCISACLKTGKGIIRSATASGKSLMISYVVKALQEQNTINNGIIIVPSIGLVTQFYEDMADYGMDMRGVGRVGDTWKEWDNPLVISTWQSLNNVRHHMERMDMVIVDECVDGDTLIKTDNGYEKIKDLVVGDIVLSYNAETCEYEEDVVEKVYENMTISSNEKMYELVFDNGVTVKVTGNHKILTTKGYIRTDELTDEHEIINFHENI